MKINWLRLAYCYFVVLVAMLAGIYYSDSAVSGWYHQINLPAFTPPDISFAYAWSFLYALMAGAFYLAFEKQKSIERNQTLNGWFLGLMFLHIVWNYAFFYTGYVGMALIVLVLIDILSYRIMMEFWSVSAPSAVMFFPYFLWILFATYLNAAIFNLNGFIIVID